MNLTPAQGVEFVKEFVPAVANAKCQIVLAPTFLALPGVAAALAGSNVSVSAQNVSQYDNGAYTGEISTAMLNDLAVEYVILGHSERRQLFGETNAIINAKIKKALAAGLKPIFCIGETLEERDGGQLEAVLGSQIIEGLKDLGSAELAQIVIAYEPVWAIGTGRTASAEQAQEAHAFCRKVLADNFGGEAAAAMRIQYGGSVKPENAEELLGQPDIDGALVGGASLQPASFAAIVNAAK